MSQDANNLPKGLNITTQIPLDVKTYIDSEDTLSHLGDSNQLAFTYPDGIKIYSILEKTVWQWRQVPNGLEDTGLLFNGDFTYPSGVNTFGIDYSNKKYNFFKIEYVNKTDEKSYDALSVGTGETIYKNKTVTGNDTVFNFKEITKADAGTTGIPVLGTVTTVSDNIVINGKRLKTDNLSITEPVAGEILINTPIDPSDIKFYVNANYTGGNSNGSLSKPYTSLKAALDAFIDVPNGGSIITPQYANIGTIELLSNVTIPATGATSMTYLSVNNLKLKGNGYRIIYLGTQEEFISTKYLVDLCPKTTLSKLDYNINMSFENVIIESQTVHKIINHLNYRSASNPTDFQNSSNISFKNCEIIDNAYLQELGDYTNTTILLFGNPIYVQNTLNKNKYMIKNENINWYGEGGFELQNCKLKGSSSTIVYNLNSSISWQNVTINFNEYFVNYKDTTGSSPNQIYNTIDGIYYILSENTGLAGRSKNYFRIENFTQSTQVGSNGGSVVGGVECVFRTKGNSDFIIFNGSFYSEKTNNLAQLNDTTSNMMLTNLNAIALELSDTTYGAFKYTGTIPGSPKFIDVNLSIINNVKNWTTLQYIRPTAASATINGAYFSDKPDFPDNAAALAGGLIPGNEYYDTTGQIATRVI